MKRAFVLGLGICIMTVQLMAQDRRDRMDHHGRYGNYDRQDESPAEFEGSFFTGGSISLAFYNSTFLVGASPVFGYSLAKWVDVGAVVNYNYTAYRDVYTFDDKLHQSVYGGGFFTKLYPVRFLFAQAQIEHNFIHNKYKLPGGNPVSTSTDEANSLLIGGGYTTGRFGGSHAPFFYLAILFDVSGNSNSPYTDNLGRTIPIVRGGIQVPLGGGKHKDKD